MTDSAYDGPVPAANVDSIVVRLLAMGYEADVDFGPGPSDFWVASKDGTDDGVLVFACDFNTNGWEAAHNPVEQDQEPLHAWLSPYASTEQVALWAAALALEPRAAYDRSVVAV